MSTEIKITIEASPEFIDAVAESVVRKTNPDYAKPINYSVNDVAEKMRLAPQTIRLHIKEGLLEADKTKGKYIITQESLDNYVNNIAI